MSISTGSKPELRRKIATATSVRKIFPLETLYLFVARLFAKLGAKKFYSGIQLDGSEHFAKLIEDRQLLIQRCPHRT